MDLNALMLLPDLDQAEVKELKTGGLSTPAYCNRCRMNWAALETVTDDEGDEQYDFCPKCQSDSFLTDPKEGPAYLMSPFDNTIIDAKTKEEYRPAPVASPVISVGKEKMTLEEWLAKEKRREQIQDSAIHIYQKVHGEQGEEAAKQAYFNKLKEINNED